MKFLETIYNASNPQNYKNTSSSNVLKTETKKLQNFSQAFKFTIETYSTRVFASNNDSQWLLFCGFAIKFMEHPKTILGAIFKKEITMEYLFYTKIQQQKNFLVTNLFQAIATNLPTRI